MIKLILTDSSRSRLAEANSSAVASLVARVNGVVAANFDGGETVVTEGRVAAPLRERIPDYAAVPLGMIVSGEIVVLEHGKGVKRLAPGDFLGLFETASYLNGQGNKGIGAWTLITDSPATVLFVPDPLHSHASDSAVETLRDYVVELARNDPVPQPLTNLPLLDEISAFLQTEVLQDTLVVTHTHLLPSNLALFRHLAHLVGYRRLVILEKAYSTVRSTYAGLVQMGADVVPVVMIEAAPYEFAVQRSVQIVWDKVVKQVRSEGIKRIAIVDDGADLLLSVPWNRLPNVTVVGVEQTQRGIDRLQNSGLKTPLVVDVATSRIKKEIEPKFIARGIVAKLDALGYLDGSLSNSVTGIIGVGKIGLALTRELSPHCRSVIHYDIDHHDLDTRDKHQITSIDTLVNQSDLVIGCAGRDVLRGVALDRIQGQKTLVSGSSADIEFLSLLNMARFPAIGFEPVEINVHDRLDVTILNAGFPVNFDRTREWENPEEMQVTRSLMLAGLMQALRAGEGEDGSTVRPLDSEIQNVIVDRWRSLTGAIKSA